MEIRKNIFHELLRDSKIDKFNELVKKEENPVDLENCNLRGVDLRQADLKNANLKNSYLKMADMRGLDLRNSLLEGASLNKARIGGVFFPPDIRADEITMSVNHGTRIRIR